MEPTDSHHQHEYKKKQVGQIVGWHFSKSSCYYGRPKTYCYYQYYTKYIRIERQVFIGKPHDAKSYRQHPYPGVKYYGKVYFSKRIDDKKDGHAKNGKERYQFKRC